MLWKVNRIIDLRDLIQSIYIEGMNTNDKSGTEIASSIGKFITLAESKMVG